MCRFANLLAVYTYAKQRERERGSGKVQAWDVIIHADLQRLPSDISTVCRTKTVPVPTKCVAMECSLRVLVLAGRTYVLQSSWRLVLVEH